MNYERFSSDEIPYGKLAQFGLSQQMIDDLPKNVMERFLSSQPTPALPVVSENVEGHLLTTPTRITLVRLADGSVDVCFAPRWTDKDLRAFSEEQQEKLMQGKVIVMDVEEKGKCFLQRGASLFYDFYIGIFRLPYLIISICPKAGVMQTLGLPLFFQNIIVSCRYSFCRMMKIAVLPEP